MHVNGGLCVGVGGCVVVGVLVGENSNIFELFIKMCARIFQFLLIFG